MKKFCKGIITVFGQQYLRSPNVADIQRLLNKAEQSGFPGMLGSLDCMHWEWKNCPTAYHGQYTGHTHRPTIVLEAVASYDLWIWHAFFGMPGSNNDINVFDASNVFANLRDGRAPAVNFIINGHEYTMGYYFADGIYLPWATIVQTITGAISPKIRHFAKKQESFRKDVERAFGVLQARFAIVRGPVRFWHCLDLSNIMKTCIILHNMIIEDEHNEENIGEVVEPHSGEYDVHDMDNSVYFSHNFTLPFEEYMNRAQQIRSQATHHALRNDLIEHLWSKEGE